MNIQKTRFCPSPTGALHLGNLRAALFSFLFSKKNNGMFLLRIEDTDLLRSEDEFVEKIYEDLEWLLLVWDEGPKVEGKHTPYFQSKRFEIYEGFYNLLLEKDLIYPCFTSEEELKVIKRSQLQAGEPPRYPGTWSQASKEEVQAELDRGNVPVYRFRMPTEGIIEFEDQIKGNQQFNACDLDDFIVKKTDGTPSFMFANAIDDALMEVSFVLRGEDHLSNTPRQLALIEALGLSKPNFAHLPLFLGHDGAPLSKRNGSVSVSELKEMGYLPIAIINYLIRVGHFIPDNNLKSLDELSELLDIDSISHSPSRFDLDQLKFWQKQAVEVMDIVEMKQWLFESLAEVLPEDVEMKKFVELIKSNVVFPNDAAEFAKAFFSKENDYSDDGMNYLKNAPEEFFNVAEQCISSSWGQWANSVKELGVKTNTKGKNLYMPIRLALTSLTSGPELDQIAELLGKDEVLKRLKAAQHIIS